MMKKCFLLPLLGLALNVSGQSVRTVNLDNYTKYEINDTLYFISTDAPKYGVATSDGKLLVPVEYDDAVRDACTHYDYGKELFFLMAKNDKWGIVSNKKVYVEPEYDLFYDLADKFVSFKKNGKFGIVTLRGRVILPGQYDEVAFYATSFFSKCDFIAARKGQQWSITGGYNLNQVDVDFPVKAQEDNCYATIGGENYQIISAFYGDFAKVSKDDLYGMVNPRGKFVVPVEFSGISALGDKFFVVQKDNQCGLYRTDGKQLAPCSYDASLGVSFDSLHVLMSKNDKIYEVDIDGNVRKKASVNDLKAKYDPWVLDCNNGQAIVYIEGKPCVMAYDGTVIIPVKYKSIKMANETGIFGLSPDEKTYYKVADKTGLFAAFDEKGVRLTEFKYEDIHYVGGDKEAFAVAAKVGGKAKCGVCDSNGREIIPLEYDNIGAAEGNVFAMKRNGKYGIVNTGNKIVVPFEIDEVKTDFGITESKMIAIESGGKWALTDGDGNRLTDYVFDLVACELTSQGAVLRRDYSEGMGLATSQSKYGYIDSRGQLAIPCIYKFGWNFSCGLAAVQDDNNQYGYIDKTGKTAIPFVFEFASSFDPVTKTAKVRLNDQQVIINTKGEVVANSWP